MDIAYNSIFTKNAPIEYLNTKYSTNNIFIQNYSTFTTNGPIESFETKTEKTVVRKTKFHRLQI